MAATPLPTGIVTFLFSDIEGSTSLLRSLGLERYRELLAAHHDLFRDLAGPAVVSTEGDSFFCVFATPHHAVEVAATIQRALSAHPWPGGVEVRVRMGIHTGEGVLGGDDYVGLAVHRAARIATAAHGGQVLISAATQAQLAAALADGIGLRDLGEHRLKDLAEPEHLYQLTIPGLRDEFPPPDSLEAPTNLPDRLSSFVGRVAEQRAVVEMLASARLLTLTGAGGSGKTRLAIETARMAAPGMPGGVFFASLATLDEPQLVPARVAAELSVSEQVGRPIQATLTDYLRPRAALLLLDNCEHLADAAAAVAEHLLRECPGLTVLATSREALLIPGEQVYPVEPMSLTGGGDDAQPDAVALFAARAGEVSPGFDLTRWAEEVAQICARLDGIPLAIELAAARVGMLTPPEVLDQLERGFDVLKSRARTGSPRHRTLEATVGWSYDLLDSGARRLLRALAAFRGGFTLEAARRVCLDGGSEITALDRLTALHDKSLITRDTSFLGTRFGMLETIRQYAMARLHGSGEYGLFARRHREYFAERAGREARRLGGGEQLDALARLEADHDNFRAVMRRAVAAGEFDTAADMAGRLVWFWYLHSHFTEGERWATQLIDELPPDPGRAWLRLLLGAGQYDFRIGNYDRCNQRLDTCLRHAHARGADRIAMWAHAYLATNALYTTDVEAVELHAGLAAELAEQIGDPIGYAYASFLRLGVECWAADVAGTLEQQAEQMLGRIAPLAAGARGSGDRNIIGHVIQLEGQLHAAAGDRCAAASSFDEAIAALTELGTVACACHCLEAIAQFLAIAGAHEPAVSLLAAAERFRDEIGITSAGIEEAPRVAALELCEAALGADGVASRSAARPTLGLAEATQLAREAAAAVAASQS